MRQGQQNRRGRGRSSSNNSNNSSRKQQNPLSRNYESSGPDVKIRGTASQIAEKYMGLARDASASGDVIQAENYLQHAEHYNRIIAAAQQAQAQQQQLQQPSVGHENGHASPTAPQRVSPEANGALRDQPQPQIPPSNASGEQPDVPAAPAEKKKAAPASKDTDGGRRRRRRYPASGATEQVAAPAEAAPAANGHANADDGRSPDEVLA